MPPYNPPTSGMSVQVSLSDTVDMYLRQWLKVASGDRAILCRHTTGMSHSFTVFKCTTCSDNFHVGDENFMGTQIPQTLKDWVHKHRHVCSKYVDEKPGLNLCKSCGWPFGAHEEFWMAAAKEVFDDSYQSPSGAKLPLQEFTGRVFRDVEES